MRIGIVSSPPNRRDSPRVLREKLLDTDLWTDSSGRPDATLLRSILGWPGCYPALRLWIERDALPYGTAGHMRLSEPPAAPRESLLKKMKAHTRRLRPVKERKPVKPRRLKKKRFQKRGSEDTSVDEDGVPQLEQLAKTAPRVSKTLSWQNVRRPLFIGLLLLVAVGISVSGVAVARQQNETRQYAACVQAVRTLDSESIKLSRERDKAKKMYEETPTSYLSNNSLRDRLGKVTSFEDSVQQLSCTADPVRARKNAKKSLRLVSSRLENLKSVENQVFVSRQKKSESLLESSLRLARKDSKLPVQYPALVNSLNGEIDTATRLVSSRKASWAKLDSERTILDRKTKSVTESAKQKKDYDRRKADKRKKRVQQSQTQSSQKNMPLHSRVYQKMPATNHRYVPASPPVRRQLVPQQSQSVPQTWNVPSQSCTEGCLG